MTHPDYDNNITHAPGRASSLTGPGRHNCSTPTTSCSSAFPGRMWRLGHREGAGLSRLSKFLVVGGTGALVNSLALLVFFKWARLPLLVASALATELSIVNNLDRKS